MEVIARGGGNLSVVLIGHPDLRNEFRRPTMEEIGHRTKVLSFEGLGEDTRAYLDWLLGECTSDGDGNVSRRQSEPSRTCSEPDRNHSLN